MSTTKMQQCPRCGEIFRVFASQSRGRTYCSRACRLAGPLIDEPIHVLAEPIEYCVECGKVFRPRAGRGSWGTICSDSCRYERRKTQAMQKYTKRAEKRPPRQALAPKRCVHCAAEFSPMIAAQKYCSGLCRQVARHDKGPRTTRRKLTPPTRPCVRCTVPVPTKPGISVCATCKTDKRDRTAVQRSRTLRQYGVDQAWYDATLAAQGNRCAICRTSDPKKRSWSIDHCHATGAVRGLLCSTCNLAVGMFGDDPAVLVRAAEYLAAHQKQEREQ